MNFLFPLKLSSFASLLLGICLATPPLAYAAGELHQAEQLVETGRATEAIALVQRFGKSSDVAWAQVHSAALLALGQSRRAVDLLAPLHAADPLNLGLANNYAVALEAIGATDTARQVLERALGDGAATAAPFRNLRSLYAKLAAAAYARAVDAPVQRTSPTLALVMPSDRQALAFTPGAGDQSPTIGRGPAPAPTIPPMAALGPALPPVPSAAPSPIAPTSSSNSGATKSAAAPTLPPVAVASAPVFPAAPPVPTGANPGAPKPTEKPLEKPTEKSPEKSPEKQANKPAEKTTDKAAESTAEKPANDRQTAALAQLERATTSWAAAWSRKDVPAYLAFYAKSFHPPTGLSRSEWEKQRHERLNRPGSIKVTIDDLKVVADGDGWKVTFRQHYRATGLESTATKSMRWVHEGGRWLIQAERAQ